MTTSRKKVLVCTALVMLTLAVYWQVREYSFITYDDRDYVSENIQVQQGLTREGVLWAFTTNHAANWHPLTWISHMLDVQLFGLDSGAHHLVNVIIHCTNALLLFLLLHSLTKSIWRSAFVAAVFALHPLRVESVAWVSERKDVLSAMFWFLTIAAYARYARQPTWKTYALVALPFTLGLMAKQMLVTVPFVLLLLDYWPLGRFSTKPSGEKSGHGTKGARQVDLRKWKGLAKEKIPLFAITVVFSTVVFLVQKGGGAMASSDYFPLHIRIENALVSYLEYVRKMLWPSDLAIFYPHPGSSLETVSVVASGAMILLISVAALYYARRIPYFFVGWFWYLGTMVPVIGIVQVGMQAMADRYTYIPMIGLTVAVAWSVPALSAKTAGFVRAVGATGVACIAMLTVLAWKQASHWQNNVTVFSHALAVTKNNYLAHNDLGSALEKQGMTEKALEHYRESLRISPNFWYAKTNLAALIGKRGELDESARLLREVLETNPKYADAHNNLGIVYAMTGKRQEALAQFSEVIKLNPIHVDALYNRGLLLLSEGRPEEAARDFREVLRINPDHSASREALKQTTDRGIHLQ